MLKFKRLAIQDKLSHSSNSKMVISGLTSNQWSILLKDFLISADTSRFRKNLFVFSSEEKAEKFYSYIKETTPTVFYPDFGSEIYSTIVPSEFNLVKRLAILNRLEDSTNEEFSIVTTIDALNLTVPPKEYFKSNNFTLSVSDLISPVELSKQLISGGFKKTPTTEEAGTFAVKGEIFDIYPLDGDPVRIQYFDEMIEEIHYIDKTTLKTKTNSSIDSITLQNTQFSLLKKNLVNTFRNNFPRPKLNEKELFSYREETLRKLSRGEFFEDYPAFISYFFSSPSTLMDYTTDFSMQIFDDFETIEKYETLKIDLEQSYKSFTNNSPDTIKPSPEEIYDHKFKFDFPYLAINNVNISMALEDDFKNHIEVKTTSIQNSINRISNSNKLDIKLKSICTLVNKLLVINNQIRIYCTNENSKKEILYLLNTYSEDKVLLSKIKFINEYLEEGFLYDHEKILFLSENDFFEKKIKKVKTKTLNVDEDMFAEQLATLKIDDHVIHKDHGVGKYKGMETLNLGGSTSDFIVLQYKDNDKIYVPVYKLNLLQKHSSSESSATLADLKSKKFDQAKTKAKSAVKKLAFDLLELQAKRKLLKGFSFSEPDHIFNEFSLSFRFKETPDQSRAIENVISDMVSDQPMDRLVCGDVGFGKTEVAMRAAFKAVLDHKQVGILVPTTVLALQHYNSFVERFKNFPVEIEFISRFKTPKQVKEVLEKLALGQIDILIGTHKLLSDKVKFSDLGLLVIDEEQRFGVSHKEKLKLFKETVDTLTLTATPIPRTLQMSFLGIKELSLIKTPPLKRQTIKSYVIKEDPQTLKLAIEKELSRGGQVFIVHNRVQDIEIFTAKIRNLVPSARLIYAHGQLPERELEKRISDFYNYKYDILISTTIIESGIDIPRANTMIVDQANNYGLSQLHQLRGRIGRSDKKAYAYFIVPSHKKLSDIAAKRLKALQTYADLGSGFSLATSDLEIRGSGDILGPEQSGHIGSIGLELYMELLKECIQELKGESQYINKRIEIQTPFDSYIPTKFISDAGLRLKYYKRISNSQTREDLEEIVDELKDQFGLIPEEVVNLTNIIDARIILNNLALKSIKVKTTSILLSFDKELIQNDQALQDKVINFFTQRPKIYKINPDYSINCSFKDKISVTTLLDFAQFLAEQLK